MDTKRQQDRTGAAVCKTMRWPAALACLAVLLFPAAADAQGTPPVNAGGSSPCLSFQTVGYSTIATNTCDIPIWVFAQGPSGGRCFQAALKPGKKTPLPGMATIRALCRRTAASITAGSCECPAGTEMSGGAAAERAPDAVAAPPAPSPTPAPAPPTAAQDPGAGLFGAVLGALTKSSPDAVRNQIERTVSQATGGSGVSVGGSSGGSSNGISAAPTNEGRSYDSSITGRSPLTQAQIDKGVKSYYENCAIHTTYLKNLHDCACLSEGYKQIAIAKRSTQLSPEEQYQIGQTCPAPKATTYAWVYQTCDDYMQHNRTDHAQFCGCSADRFSSTFQGQPNSNLRKVEALRKESMVACGLADRSHNIHGK